MKEETILIYKGITMARIPGHVYLGNFITFDADEEYYVDSNGNEVITSFSMMDGDVCAITHTVTLSRVGDED